MVSKHGRPDQGRLDRTENADGSTESSEFDANGNVIAKERGQSQKKGVRSCIDTSSRKRKGSGLVLTHPRVETRFQPWPDHFALNMKEPCIM
jgi:YD repeat-containing protein